MDGPLKKFSIFSISWLMEVCNFLVYCTLSCYSLSDLILFCKLVMVYAAYFFAVRSIVFVFRRDVQKLQPEVKNDLKLESEHLCISENCF